MNFEPPCEDWQQCGGAWIALGSRTVSYTDSAVTLITRAAKRLIVGSNGRHAIDIGNDSWWRSVKLDFGSSAIPGRVWVACSPTGGGSWI